MLFACLTEKSFSFVYAIRHGEYFEAEFIDEDFLCTYSLNATYFWGFFALLALILLVDALNTIKHGKYRPQFRSSSFWPLSVFLALDSMDDTFYGGNNGHNLCVLISQVPGIDCRHVLGALVTYAVLSAAISYYINLYCSPRFRLSNRDLRTHPRKRVLYLSTDKSTKTEEARKESARRRTEDTPPPLVWFGSPISPDARIGCSGNPQDWWKPSQTEQDLLFRVQSGSSFESKKLQGIKIVSSVASGSSAVHSSEEATAFVEESEILATSSNIVRELPTFTTPASIMSEPHALSPVAPTFKTPPVFTSCSQSFRNRAEYNRHKRYHDKPVICPHCPRGFGTTKDLGRHINDIHERTKVWHCAEATCRRSRMLGGKGFPRKDNWRRHMRDAHGIKAELEDRHILMVAENGSVSC